MGGGRRGLLFGRQRADRMDRQSSTSGNGNYCNCSKIFDPHGDGSSIGRHGLTGHSLKWFQSAHLIWSAIAAVALLTAASTRHAAAAAIGHCKNFHSLAGTKAPNLGANDPIFCAASSSIRRLGAPIASSRPNGVTIRSQGTKAPVKTLEARDRRSPLTTRRMSRIAKGSYCRARCCQKQSLAQIAKSGGLRFR